SLKTSIKTITYLSDIGCLEIHGASLFYLLPVESISSLSSIYECMFSGRLLFGNSPHKLTMNEMIILFYYVFHGWNVASIAYQFGMSSKTVYTHIYKAKKKNGISGKNLKYKCAYERLVC
ncbi:hypothetical protein OFO05_21640, partial [Escherichia coli]|nr:hypothetical protein [Escherichia coli]